MVSSVHTTNPEAGTVNTVISGIGSVVIKAAETAIITQLPFLGFPLIKPIWETIFNYICSFVVNAAETEGTFTVIDLQVSDEQSNLATALKNLLIAEKEGNPDAIKSAIQAYANAHSALINSNGYGVTE